MAAEFLNVRYERVQPTERFLAVELGVMQVALGSLALMAALFGSVGEQRRFVGVRRPFSASPSPPTDVSLSIVLLSGQAHFRPS